jgi:pyruvate,water dikinase
VRSSATAEDLPDASFAGQQETFLNVVGVDDVLHKMKEVFASLYNDRAISYRVHKGFAHADVALLAGVQRMVRSDVAPPASCSRSTPRAASATWSSSPRATARRDRGAGRREPRRVLRAQAGRSRPDRFPVIRRSLGSKLIRMEFASPEEKAASGRLVRTVETPPEQRNRYSLADADVIELAALRAHHREALRPPDGHRVGQGRRRRPAVHPAGAPETVKSQSAGQAEHATS